MALSKIVLLAPGASKKGSGGYTDKSTVWAAHNINKSQGYVREKLSLLETSPEFQKAVRENRIPPTFNRVIKHAPEAFRKQVEKKIVAGGFTTRDNATIVVNAIRQSPEKAAELLSKDYAGADSRLVIKTVRGIVPEYTATPRMGAMITLPSVMD
jgi:hypothetical protein